MKHLKTIKNFLLKYKHGAVLSYFFIYIIWFGALERKVTTNFYPIHIRLDDYISFNELFVIPYLLWFLYIFITIVYLFFTSTKDFYKSCAYLFSGMTICLIIYTVWPNGHNLRVDLASLGRNNILLDIVNTIYTLDTPTNVAPSIHVFNSVGAYIAIQKNERLHNIKWIQYSALILTILICLSTVYLKQHSAFDIFMALILNLVLYGIIYVPSRNTVVREDKSSVTKTT